MIRALKPVLFVTILMLLASESALAQFSYGSGSSNASARAAGPMVALADFSFRPAQAPDVSFQFVDPIYGVFYSREGFVGRLARGGSTDADGSDLTLVDGSVDAWVNLRPFRISQEEGVDLFFPVGLHGDYRKTNKQDEELDGTVFEVSVVALAAGAGLAAPVGKSRVSVRSQPFIGFASRSFGTDTGSSAGYTVDVEWSLPEISSRFGVYVGWGYRWQRWLLSASAVFAQTEADNVEYRSAQHAFQVGLTF